MTQSDSKSITAANRVFLRNEGWQEWEREGHETDVRRGLPAPPPEQPIPPDTRRIDLIAPADFTVGDMPVREAMARRKSRRRYTPDPLSLEELSFLLWSCQGVRKIVNFELGRGSFRTVPSGGARQPFETYICLNHVDEMAPGLYRYLPFAHQLLCLRESPTLMEEAAAASVGNTFICNCAAYFIWTAVPARTECQYSIVAAKIITLDAGHACQNLHLAAEALNLGACAIVAFYQQETDALLGVDGQEEFAFYAATVGKVGG